MKKPWHLISLTALAGLAGIAGCSGGADGGGGALIDNGFESDDPSGKSAAERNGSSSGGSGGADAGAAAPSAGADEGEKGGDAARAVEEADVVSVDGNRLYALSRFGGLAIVDISNPDHLKLLGRKRTDGIPFEMYVRNGRAYVMLNDFGRWVKSETSAYGSWVTSSEILALDVTNPSAISELAHYDVPGSIADSRVVGDALYLVTYENGYCWRCSTKPGTVVTSFNVAGSAIAKVDQLAFTSPNASYSSWQRSVSATNERLYIAGPEWNWTPGTQQANSIIQVVDITNPTGHMVKGADVPVAGQVQSRWQMDEYGGYLRVVSQFGSGWGPNGSVNPKVQTFTVTSSSQITPLGETELILPKPETLRSVRFDGVRGYAITAERTDPLFTIDLANPALPKQAADLEMPGWIFHMEPRGDRLVGFGYDSTGRDARLAVSLFDVADLTKPTMLKRVSFGNGWGQLAEDQDRIHKSVRILDDAGLILVPFASYGRWDGGNCAPPQSGIQLIDYSHETLALRGLAPQYGLPRRALVANNRLLAMSDRNVSSFDITTRDAPKKTSELDLSNPAYRMVEVGDHIAAMTNDWWTGEAVLSFVSKANADDADVSGKISLASLATPDPSLCNGTSSAWTSWYEARLFAHGSFVYLTVPIYSYTYADNGPTSRDGKIIVAAIDATNPLEPVLAGRTEIALTKRDTSGYYYSGSFGFFDGYGLYSYLGGASALAFTGEGVVQHEGKLAYLEVDNEPVDLGESEYGGRRYEVKVHRKLHVVDLTTPTAPVVHPPVDLGESLGATPLHIQNGTVLTSRWLPSTQIGSSRGVGKVRFYVDRVDISGATPSVLSSINTPGSLLLADGPSNRWVTVDYAAKAESVTDYADCQTKLGARARFDYDTKVCLLVDRSFKLADVEGTRVTLRQTMTPPAQNIGGIRVADDRIYVTRYKRYDYSAAPSTDGSYEYPVLEDGGLWAIGGIRDGHLDVVSQATGDANWPLAANGTKVALYTEGGLAIYDTATPTPTLIKEANLRGYGYSSHVLLGADRAICSLGELGIQTIHY